MISRFSTALTVASLIAVAECTYAREPWTCRQLETSTDAFYRMFPAFLGSIAVDTNQSLKARQGHCFMSIDISTNFEESVEDDGTKSLKASVTFDLGQSLGFCMEHLQISTAFSDYYNFYVWHGSKTVNLTYRDEWEIADVL